MCAVRSELDHRVVVSGIATIHDAFEGLLEQKLLLCFGEVRSAGIVEAEQLEDQCPVSAFGVDAVCFVLFPFRDDIRNDVLENINIANIHTTSTKQSNLLLKILLHVSTALKEPEAVDALCEAQLLLDKVDDVAAGRAGINGDIESPEKI